MSIVPSAEVADILCHRLLRHCDFALTLASEMSESDKTMDRYLAVRLMFSLVSKYPQEALKIARKEMARNDRFTSMVAHGLEDEAKFILGD